MARDCFSGRFSCTWTCFPQLASSFQCTHCPYFQPFSIVTLICALCILPPWKFSILYSSPNAFSYIYIVSTHFLQAEYEDLYLITWWTFLLLKYCAVLIKIDIVFKRIWEKILHKCNEFKYFSVFYWQDITLDFALPVWTCTPQTEKVEEYLSVTFSNNLITTMRWIIAWNLLLQKLIC